MSKAVCFRLPLPLLSFLFLILIPGSQLFLSGVNAVEPAALADADRRHEQLGRWFCEGTTGTPEQQRPYYGRLHNQWDLDGTAWLVLHFREQSPPAGQEPMVEKQFWTYDAMTGRHTRYILVASGDHATATAPGWQGDTLDWDGSGNLGGLHVHFHETVQRLSPTQYRWIGTIDTVDGHRLVQYDMLCRKGSA